MPNETEHWQFDLDVETLPKILHITTPSGFKINLRWADEAILFLGVLGQSELLDILTTDVSRFNIYKENLVVVYCDPWENPGWTAGQAVCRKSALSFMLAKFIANYFKDI